MHTKVWVIFLRKSEIRILEALENLGGKADTKEVAEKVEWKRNRVLNRLKSLNKFGFINREMDRPIKWKLRDEGKKVLKKEVD